MTKLNPDFIVGIGGSAGGLKAYTTLLESLPSNTGMAFIFIAHLSPYHESLLAHLLSRSTNMSTIQATEEMAIEADHVYVIPPNANLFIENYAFKVITPHPLNQGQHKQVDLFFISLAATMRDRAIGIVLSGGDGDGTEGCKAIKSMGGKTFAQDLSANVDSMPLHAQASGCVDIVLPPEKISEKLIQIASDFAEERRRLRVSRPEGP